MEGQYAYNADMDEILIDEKRYISSKRAAKITGYAKDYIGQLCREGRVPARLVGRGWYVLETAIQDHRFGTKDIEEKKKDPGISLRRVMSGEWEPPRYEPTPVEVLPAVHRVKNEGETVNMGSENQEESSVDMNTSLQDSWREWFDHIAKAEPAIPQMEENRAGEPHAEEKVEEKGNAEEGGVEVPIRAIYELPPDNLLPRHPARVQMKDMLREEEGKYVLAQSEEKRPIENVKIGWFVKTTQVMGLILALATAVVAILNTGYLDQYLISNKQVSAIAGVIFYNK